MPWRRRLLVLQVVLQVVLHLMLQVVVVFVVECQDARWLGSQLYGRLLLLFRLGVCLLCSRAGAGVPEVRGGMRGAMAPS